MPRITRVATIVLEAARDVAKTLAVVTVLETAHTVVLAAQEIVVEL